MMVPSLRITHTSYAGRHPFLGGRGIEWHMLLLDPDAIVGLAPLAEEVVLA